ncbi:transcription elongation factor GreA [Gordonia jinghuaiqii]|uniref:GreA/GreB family elongation factor n=1 Tax=Gordonia jinghuaiqii TaxID=2758710 RepID=A0A7D7LP89_9ACTN|nr:GreA/GreB family elongation factor [Gordonia jinghuaiqii]MCR5976720.1 transcription elongation factor GreA [Gordonia jinghuaiqii]QMS99899.1 GreA/GreB family elongation factor [Gordonia jinghuaiqii]
MTAAPSAPYTPVNRARIENELASSCRERALVSAEVLLHRSAGDLDNNDAYHRAVARLESLDTHLAQLYAALSTAGVEPTADGTVQIGSIVTVMFDHDPGDVTTFLVGAPEQFALVGMDVCSPDSPLGKAVLGADTADDRSYRLPNGGECTITIRDHHLASL